MLQMIKLIKIFAIFLYNSVVKFESLRNIILKQVLKFYIIKLISNYLFNFINKLKNTLIFKILSRIYKIIVYILIGITTFDFTYLYFDFKLSDLSNIIDNLPRKIEDLFNKIQNFIKLIINRIKGKVEKDDYCSIDFNDTFINSTLEKSESKELSDNLDNPVNPSIKPLLFLTLTII